jgi:uncharacterized damage-inducible protein DinB
MNIQELIQQSCDYSYWANHRYFAVAEGLTAEQLHRIQGHSWGDVHAILVHMMSSEWIWLQRWQGSSPKGHLNKDDFPRLDSLKEHWNKIEADLRAFLAAQTADSLESVITYNNLSGETFHVPLWQMFMHIANHETHHRGELAGMFALMNVPHPEDEMIQYFLNLSGQKKF